MMTTGNAEDGQVLEPVDLDREADKGGEGQLPLPVQAVQSAAGAAVEVQRAAERTARQATLPWWMAVARGEQWQAVAGGLFAAFLAVLVWVRRNRSAELDLAVTIRVQSRTHPWLSQLMSLVSWPGFPPQSRLIPPLLAGLVWSLGFHREAKFQLAAWGTSFLSGGFKLLMHRARPSQPQVRVVVANLGGSSFPSGHVLNYVGTYGFVSYLVHTLVRPAIVRRPLLAFLTALIALVGPSRIYQGHHWPTDVLASYMLGLSYLVGLTALYRKAKLGSAR
jgi:membrane-associated phospholipid phosphatase